MKFSLKSPVLANLSPEETESLLKNLNARTSSYTKEELILQEGTITEELALVLSGNVRIERIDFQGNRSILANISKGQVVAETYAFLPDEPMMVDVVAASDCELLFLNLKKLYSPSVRKQSWYPVLLFNLLTIAGHKNIELSGRNFHTFPRQIRGRVLSYLTSQAHRKDTAEFDIPFNRQQLADYLNVDRSALSGELSKMQEEGIIEFRKNHFKLLSRL